MKTYPAIWKNSLNIEKKHLGELYVEHLIPLAVDRVSTLYKHFLAIITPPPFVRAIHIDQTFTDKYGQDNDNNWICVYGQRWYNQLDNEKSRVISRHLLIDDQSSNGIKGNYKCLRDATNNLQSILYDHVQQSIRIRIRVLIGGGNTYTHNQSTNLPYISLKWGEHLYLNITTQYYDDSMSTRELWFAKELEVPSPVWNQLANETITIHAMDQFTRFKSRSRDSPLGNEIDSDPSTPTKLSTCNWPYAWDLLSYQPGEYKHPLITFNFVPNGVYTLLKQIDACNVLYGSNTTCMGCDGIVNSGAFIDSCKKCTRKACIPNSSSTIQLSTTIIFTMITSLVFSYSISYS